MQSSGRSSRRRAYDAKRGDGEAQFIREMADLELAEPQRERSGHASSHRHRHRRQSQTQKMEPKEKLNSGVPHHSRSSRAHHPSGAATVNFPAKGDFPEDVENDIISLRNFYTKYRSTVCRKCQAPLGTKVGVTRHLKQWSCVKSSTGSVRSVCSTACSSCSALTCLGCGKKPIVGVNVRKTEYGILDWCCDEGRLIAIWFMVARYDEIHMQVDFMAFRNSRHHKTDHSSRGPKAMAKGVGYAEDDLSWDQTPWEPIYDSFSGLKTGTTATKAINFKQADSLTDDVLEQILSLVCALLPVPTEMSTFDQDPPLTLRAFFQLGLLLEKLAELLRNDSINDLSTRASLYFAVLELVRKLAGHPGTSSLVTAERHSKKYTKSLQVIAGAEEPTTWAKFSKARGAGPEPLSISGTSSSLASLIQGLVKQSMIILGAPQEFVGKSGQKTLYLCSEVCTLDATIRSMTTGDEDKGKGKGKANASPGGDAAVDRWTAWHKEHGLEHTDEVPGKYYYYLKELSRMGRSPKGRIPRLIKEAAEMSTGLPPGIIVRVSPERPDVMKCLIIGPDDTPYAGGLFEFDILASENYPNEPPKFHFLTTGGGEPVCLSLLGTWEGPPESKWQAQKSTILQVLLSIQSMILVADPWRNEPLNQSDTSRAAAESCRHYSHERQVYTVLHAMVPWLRQRGGPWADAVDVYFGCHARPILRTVRNWARRNPLLMSFRSRAGYGCPLLLLEDALAARGYI